MRYTWKVEGMVIGPKNAEKILANNVIFIWEFNPHKVHLFVFNDQYGFIGAVWAGNLQDALDEMADNDLLDSMMIDAKEYDKMSKEEQDEVAYLGNASEPFDLTYIGVKEVWNLPVEMIAEFAEARGANAANLDLI